MKCVGGPMDGKDGPNSPADRLLVPALEVHPNYLDDLESHTFTFDLDGYATQEWVNGEPAVRYPAHVYKRDGKVWRYMERMG